MTGHQVFTTLHTNSALGVFPRLLDIGIQADIMAGNIIGVIAQRLVRTLCVNCKSPYRPGEEERSLLRGMVDHVAELYRAVGCRQCDEKGYRGRMAIMELLVMDADLDDLVARRATMRELRTEAIAKGYVPLAEVGLRRVAEGATTLAELARAVDLTGRYG
jgi:type II secretory ATPase GspE/PulE/Tfp pilus assembly ATPase PilB-like protein